MWFSVSTAATGTSRCTTRSKKTMWLPNELPVERTIDATGVRGPTADASSAPVTTDEAGGLVLPLGLPVLRAAKTTSFQ